MKFATMPIDSPAGTKVIFQQSSPEQVQWGGHDDPNGILVLGQQYEVDHTEIHSQHTKVYLKGFPNKEFNSCSFSLDKGALTGVELIADERARQIQEEGWTPEHDDSHDKGELLDAGQSYIRAIGVTGDVFPNMPQR